MLFGPDRPTDHKIISLLKEPHNPPVRRGPVTFCPEGLPGVLGIHQFRREKSGIFTRYPVDPDISLYLHVLLLEIIRMNGASEYRTDYMMHMDPLHPPITEALSPTEIAHRDPMKPAEHRTTADLGFPWRGRYTLREGAFDLADMALMCAELKTSSDDPMPVTSDLLFIGNMLLRGLSRSAQTRIKQQFRTK